MTPQIWYQLVDALTGGPFADTSPDSVPRTSTNNSVQAFRAEVYAKDLTHFTGLIGSQLRLFKTQSEFDNDLAPLRSSDELTSLGEDEDHALIVVVPATSIPALPTIFMANPMEMYWNPPQDRVQLSISAETRALELPRACTLGSGMDHRDKPLTLFCRPQVLEQWKKVYCCCIRTYALLWIVGPPGTGKSCTALAFAYALRPSQWDVLWIHLSKKYGVARCVWLRGDEKVTCTLDMTTLSSQLLLLLSKKKKTSNKKKTIVFLDGYDYSNNEAMNAGFNCMKWRDDDVIKHRLVVVCSTVRLGGHYRLELTHKIPDTVAVSEEAAHGVKFPVPAPNNSEEGEDGEMFELDETDWQGNKVEVEVRDAMRFLLGSWSLEDYRDAAKDEKFQSVKSVFPSYIVPEDAAAAVAQRRQLVEMKHCIAGGSALLMFGVSVDNAVNELDDAVGHLMNVGVIESLLAMYPDEYGNDETVLLSAYVARQIAVRRGFDTLEKIATARRVIPPVDEWLFEAWFLSTLKTEGIHFKAEGDPQTGGKWKRADVVFFDPSKDSIGVDLEHATWVTPVQWSEAGYDAAFVDKPNGLVRFVQVTRADNYCYDCRCFIEFVGKLLAQEDVQLEKVELVFVVPMGQLSVFRCPVTSADFKENVIQGSSSSHSSAAAVTLRGHMVDNCEAEVQTLEVDYDVSAHH